jgi:serine/threonine protein kinase
MHRDLKLGNILLNSDQNLLKLADFGLAIRLKTSLEERHTICGTPDYLAPEVLSQQPYGLKCDIWAFG